MEKETLEEAAEKFGGDTINDDIHFSFIAGAKWQAERMYNEEEVLELILNRPGPYLSDEEIKEWFQKHKKK